MRLSQIGQNRQLEIGGLWIPGIDFISKSMNLSGRHSGILVLASQLTVRTVDNGLDIKGFGGLVIGDWWQDLDNRPDTDKIHENNLSVEYIASGES